jgi:YebC/PmpR family DNA-binding regulatory protein
MAGHSKWKQIKRKKAVNDNRRGATISKNIAAIQAAIRSGGGSSDPTANLAFKNALASAKSDGVSVDNINRAIERASNMEGGGPEEVIYEGYGPYGVAVMVYALTDNRNRTGPEVRHAFTKHGGSMSGGVAWMFSRKGYLVLPKADESTQELAIELGADDMEVFEDEDGNEKLEVYTGFGDLYAVAEGFRAKGIEPETAEFDNIPATKVDLSEEETIKVLKLIDLLEDLDDVQSVYSNANFTEA